MLINERIKQARKAMKLSKAELADKIGVSIGDISDWESGRKKPESYEVMSLFRALNINTDEYHQYYGNDPKPAEEIHSPQAHFGNEMPVNKPTETAQRDYSIPSSYGYESFLRKDERILWKGKPAYAFNKMTSIPIIFGIFWLCFSLFWTISAFRMGGAFGIAGLPFCGIGVFICIILPSIQKKQCLATTYYITNQRVIRDIANPKKPSFNEASLESLGNLSYFFRKERRGDVMFGRQITNVTIQYGSRNNQNMAANNMLFDAFYGIDNPDSVYNILSSAVEQCHKEEQK